VNWWQRLRHRDRLERELDDELRYHLDRQVDDRPERIMSIHARDGAGRWRGFGVS
jgi:hypothetical protein